MRARARRIADSGDPRVTEVRALQDDDPDIAVPDGNAAIVENRQDGPFEMRRHQLLTVRRQVGAFLATSLVFGVVAACAAEPKVYSLELEGYETLMQAFLPEEERAIETLIAIPSTSSLAGNFWDDVTLCFSTEESALQYHAALMGRSECPRASDFEISGHLVRRNMQARTLVHVDLLPRTQRQEVWRTWKARDGEQTPILQIDVGRDHRGAVVGRLVSIDFAPGAPYFQK